MRIKMFILLLLLLFSGVGLAEAKGDLVEDFDKWSADNHRRLLSSSSNRNYNTCLDIRIAEFFGTYKGGSEAAYLNQLSEIVKNCATELPPDDLKYAISQNYPYRKELLSTIKWRTFWETYMRKTSYSAEDMTNSILGIVIGGTTGISTIGSEVIGAIRKTIDAAPEAIKAETLYTGEWQGEDFKLNDVSTYDVVVMASLFKNNGSNWDGDIEEREHRAFFNPDLAVGIRPGLSSYDYEYFPKKFSKGDKSKDRYLKWYKRAGEFGSSNKLNCILPGMVIRIKDIDITVDDIDYQPGDGRAENLGSKKNFNIDSDGRRNTNISGYEYYTVCKMEHAKVLFYKRKKTLDSKAFTFGSHKEIIEKLLPHIEEEFQTNQQNTQPSVLEVLTEQDSNHAGSEPNADPGNSKPLQIEW